MCIHAFLLCRAYYVLRVKLLTWNWQYRQVYKNCFWNWMWSCFDGLQQQWGKWSALFSLHLLPLSPPRARQSQSSTLTSLFLYLAIPASKSTTVPVVTGTRSIAYEDHSCVSLLLMTPLCPRSVSYEYSTSWRSRVMHKVQTQWRNTEHTKGIIPSMQYTMQNTRTTWCSISAQYSYTLEALYPCTLWRPSTQRILQET